MKIIFKEHEGKTIRLMFPSGAILRLLSSKTISKKLIQKTSKPSVEMPDMFLTGKQRRLLIHELRKCRKHFPDWCLVEVKSKDGDNIKIKL